MVPHKLTEKRSLYEEGILQASDWEYGLETGASER